MAGLKEPDIINAPEQPAQTTSQVVQKPGSRGLLLEVHQKPGASRKQQERRQPDQDDEDPSLVWLREQQQFDEIGLETQVISDFADASKGSPLSEDEIDKRIADIDAYRQKRDFDTADRLQLELVADSMKTFAIPEHIKETIAGANRWALKNHLGQGGMGAVYKAYDLNLRRDAAVKVMKPADSGSAAAEFFKRFQREGRALAKLNNPYVVRVYDAAFDKEGGFIAMDLIDGQDLDDQIKEHQGVYSVDEAARIGLDIANGLAAMHEAGIVHRDIKPANIMFSKRKGHHVIADFGMTFLVGQKGQESAQKVGKKGAPVEPRITDPETVMGTPLYISPENAVGSERMGPPTDIWALGVVLYQLTAGKMPFDGDNPVDVLTKVVRGQSWPLKTYREDLPESFLNLVRDMMKHDPAGRPTAQEVASRLKDILLEKHINIIRPPQAAVESHRQDTATSLVKRPTPASEIETAIMKNRPQVEDTEKIEPPQQMPTPPVPPPRTSAMRRFIERISSMFRG